MPEDNIPNEEFDNEDLQQATDVVGGDLDAEVSVAPNSQAVDYNFSEVEGTAVNEVQIEQEPVNDGPVTVRPVEFTPFDSYTPTNTDTNKNFELLMDIKLELTVELGRCQLPVKKVLELTRGSIIELDKVAGESVELYANGKHVANGEVVFIEDNFGLRITSITDPEERIKSL